MTKIFFLLKLQELLDLSRQILFPLTLAPLQNFFFIELDAFIDVVIVVVVVDVFASAQSFKVEGVDSLQSSLRKKMSTVDREFHEISISLVIS